MSGTDKSAGSVAVVFPPHCGPLSPGLIPSPGAVCPFGFQSKLASVGFCTPVFLLHLKLGFLNNYFWKKLFGLIVLGPIGCWYGTAPWYTYIPCVICCGLQKTKFMFLFKPIVVDCSLLILNLVDLDHIVFLHFYFKIAFPKQFRVGSAYPDAFHFSESSLWYPMSGYYYTHLISE